jgi:hypothetical protein
MNSVKAEEVIVLESHKIIGYVVYRPTRLAHTWVVPSII